MAFSSADPSGLIFSSAEPSESVVCFSFSGVSPEVESALFVLSPLVSVLFLGFSIFGFGLGILLTLATYINTNQISIEMAHKGRKIFAAVSNSPFAIKKLLRLAVIPCLADSTPSNIFLQMSVLVC